MRICKNHVDDFSDIVACNSCDCLGGYVLRDTKGGIFLAQELPNLWITAKDAKAFAKKYAMAKSWKPKRVYIHFG